MTDSQEGLPDDDHGDGPQPGRSIRRLLMLTAAIGLLPSLITITGQAPTVLKWVHPPLANVTEFGTVRCHWWNAVEIRGLRVHNTREWSQDVPPFLTADRLTTKRALWEIAFNLGRKIDVTIEAPVVTLIESANRSNLREAIEDLSRSPGTSSSVPFRLQINQGKVQLASLTERDVTDDESAEHSRGNWNTQTLIAGIHCDLSTLTSMGAVPDISLAATVGDVTDTTSNRVSREKTVNPRIAARLDHLAADFSPLEIEAPSHTDGVPTVLLQSKRMEGRDGHTVAMQAANVPLETLEPLISQLIPGTQCGGRCSARARIVLAGEQFADGIAVNLAVRGRDVQWRQASWAEDEALYAESFSLDCATAVAEDGIAIRRMTIDCPFGKVEGHGEIRLPQQPWMQAILAPPHSDDPPTPPATVGLVPVGASGNALIQGSADLVALSRMIPRTMRLHEGIRLQQGTLRFAVRTVAATDNSESPLSWEAFAETSPLVARRNQQTISWDAPIRLRGSGPMSPTSTGLTSAELSGDFGRVLTRPLQDALQVSGSVDVDKFWKRAGPFLNLTAPGLRGKVRINAEIDANSSDVLTVRELTVNADNFQATSPQLKIRPDTSLVRMLEGELTLRGSGSAVRNVAAPWMNLSWLSSESDLRLDVLAEPERMTLAGEVRPAREASRSSRRADAADFTIDQGLIALDIEAISDTGHYAIRKARVQVPGLDTRIVGGLEVHHDVMSVNLTADARYDLAALKNLLLDDPDQRLSVTGVRDGQFSIRGAPAWWRGNAPQGIEPLHVTGQLSWATARVYGLELGPATVPFQLMQGQIHTETIRCSVNGGQLHAMLNYDLPQNVLALSSGSRVEHLQVTQEVCSEWLGYVTPFLADGSSVNGRVSARLRRCVLPLDRFSATTMSGQLEVHDATAKPGASLTSLLQLIDLLRPGQRSAVRELQMPPQTVEFDLRDGVISHEQVALNVSGYDLRSRGSVSLEQRLNVTLDIPLQRSEDGRRGRWISVPVTGTVTQPSVDASQFLQDVGTRRLQGEFDRGLNRLLDSLR